MGAGASHDDDAGRSVREGGRGSEDVAWITVPRSSALAEAVVHKGLDNPREAHNCFVNVVLQGLWHLAAFRHALLNAPSHTHTDGRACMTCALRAVFTFYQYGDEASIPPDSVRGVLASLYADQQRFQSGEMADAGETLMAVLRALHEEHLEATGSLPDGHPRLLAQRAAQAASAPDTAPGSRTKPTGGADLASPIILDGESDDDYASGDDSDEEPSGSDSNRARSVGKGDRYDAAAGSSFESGAVVQGGPSGAAPSAGSTSGAASRTASSAGAGGGAGAAMPASRDLMDVPCSPPCPAHAVFSHSFLAWNRCPTCRASSDPVPREDLLYLVYVSDVIDGAAALQAAAAAAGRGGGVGSPAHGHPHGHAHGVGMGRSAAPAGTVDITSHPYYIAGATGSRPSAAGAGGGGVGGVGVGGHHGSAYPTQSPLPGLMPPGISYAPGSAAAAAAALGYGAGAVPPGLSAPHSTSVSSPLARTGAHVLQDPAYTTGVGELSPAQVTGAAGGRPTLGALLSFVAAREEIDSVLGGEAAAAASAASSSAAGTGGKHSSSPAASPALPRRSSRVRASSTSGIAVPTLSSSSSSSSSAGGSGADAPLPPRRPHPLGSSGCSDSRIAPERVLLAAPRVFVVSLAWPSDSATKAQVGEAMALLGQLLDMRAIFRLSADMQAAAQANSSLLPASPASSSSGGASLAIGPAAASASGSAAGATPSCGSGGAGSGHTPSGNVYRLRGLVCYYGKHWVAFMASESRRSWLLFDDDAVGDVGSWTKVVERVVRSRYQPTLLFFEQLADAAPARTPTAASTASIASTSGAAAGTGAGATAATHPTASVTAVAPVLLRPAGSDAPGAVPVSPERDLLHMSLLSPTPAQIAAATAAEADAAHAAHTRQPAAFPLAPGRVPQLAAAGAIASPMGYLAEGTPTPGHGPGGAAPGLHKAQSAYGAGGLRPETLQLLRTGGTIDAHGSLVPSRSGSDSRSGSASAAASSVAAASGAAAAAATGVRYLPLGSAMGPAGAASAGTSSATALPSVAHAAAGGLSADAILRMLASSGSAVGVGPAASHGSVGIPAGSVGLARTTSAGSASGSSSAASSAASAPVMAPASGASSSASSVPAGEEIAVSLPASVLQRIMAVEGLESVGLRATLGILLAPHSSATSSGGAASASQSAGVSILRVMHSGSTLANTTPGSVGGILPQSHPLARLMSGDVLLAVQGRPVLCEADADEVLRDAALSAASALSDGHSPSSGSGAGAGGSHGPGPAAVGAASGRDSHVGASTVRHATRAPGPQVTIVLTVRRRDGPLPGLRGAAAGVGSGSAGRTIVVSTGLARW